jgi:hypothetical protein
MASATRTTAEIKVEGASNNTAQTIKVQFNPSEYSISRSAQFSQSHGIAPAPNGQNNSTEGSFLAGSEESTFKVKLTLDGFAKAGTMREEDAQDISNDAKAIKSLVLMDEKLHHPPACVFTWGLLSFRGYVTNVEEHYTMFSTDGKPLRATLDLTMKEIDPRKLSLESPDRSKRRLVIQGTHISQLAEEAYHDSALWRPIAMANNIRNPRRLRQGEALVVPPLEAELWEASQ